LSEPTNGELARRLDSLVALVKDLIGQREYQEFQRSVERRLGVQDRRFAEVRSDAEAEYRELRQEMDESDRRAEQRHLSWRTIIYTGLVPALVAAAAILVNVWLNHGGH
jgi:hypothetical protein